MPLLVRSTRSLVRPFRFTSTPITLFPRYASASYGGHNQSGQEGDIHAKNPKEQMEHPGPETPASQGSSSASPSSSSSSDASKVTRARLPFIPRLQRLEKDDPEVRKHNEDMAKRSDRSVNQLSEADNKVNPNFWKGDVGPKKE